MSGKVGDSAACLDEESEVLFRMCPEQPANPPCREKGVCHSSVLLWDVGVNTAGWEKCHHQRHR